MIRKAFLELIYESAHMRRWNDHIRPRGFTELDKQAHKMLIVFVLAKFEEDKESQPLNWQLLIQGGIFEFFHRICLTDIKPSVCHELMLTHGKELNEWVLKELKSKLEGITGNFYPQLKEYFFNAQYAEREKKVLRAAHYLATNWEFKIIHNLNANVYGLDETKLRIDNEISEHFDLVGVQKIFLDKKLADFINLVGQLRFQQRWAQSPRVPETSVMGHMLIVAILAYVCSLEVQACQQRLCNNFLAGLFHDLPEVFTRDIVSPVKRSVDGLDSLIKQIENRYIEQKLLPLLPTAWHQQLRYFIDDEFADKIIVSGQMQKVNANDISKYYNEDCYCAIDGSLLKACDHLAAYIEAKLSIAHGIQSRHLCEGAEELYNYYEHKTVSGMQFGQLFDYFK